MTRLLSFVALSSAVLAGGSGRPAWADPLKPSASAPLVIQLVAHGLSAEIASILANALLRIAMGDLREGKYTARAVAVTAVPNGLGPCLTLPQSFFDVTMRATDDGRPVSRNPLSCAVPYDPNVQVDRTSVVQVEVAAFYHSRTSGLSKGGWFCAKIQSSSRAIAGRKGNDRRGGTTAGPAGTRTRSGPWPTT